MVEHPLHIGKHFYNVEMTIAIAYYIIFENGMGNKGVTALDYFSRQDTF